MTFAEWIDQYYRAPDEPVTRAIERFAMEPLIRSTYKTLFYAYKGARVGPDLAKKVETFSGGRVHAADLVLLPRAEELRAATGTEG